MRVASSSCKAYEYAMKVFMHVYHISGSDRTFMRAQSDKTRTEGDGTPARASERLPKGLRLSQEPAPSAVLYPKPTRMISWPS